MILCIVVPPAACGQRTHVYEALLVEQLAGPRFRLGGRVIAPPCIVFLQAVPVRRTQGTSGCTERLARRMAIVSETKFFAKELRNKQRLPHAAPVRLHLRLPLDALGRSLLVGLGFGKVPAGRKPRP